MITLVVLSLIGLTMTVFGLFRSFQVLVEHIAGGNDRMGMLCLGVFLLVGSAIALVCTPDKPAR